MRQIWLAISRHLCLRDKLGFWGWLKRLLKTPSQPNPAIPTVLRGNLTQSDGDVVLSTCERSEAILPVSLRTPEGCVAISGDCGACSE